VTTGRTGGGSEIIGANTEIIFNTEFIFPILPERVKGVVFYDAGRGFDNELLTEPDKVSIRGLKSSVGAGLRFILPIGPIRLEYGFNLNRQPGEKQGEFEVSIGTLF
jgi:outer membrane protein insertion porin family